MNPRQRTKNGILALSSSLPADKSSFVIRLIRQTNYGKFSKTSATVNQNCHDYKINWKTKKLSQNSREPDNYEDEI